MDVRIHGNPGELLSHTSDLLLNTTVLLFWSPSTVRDIEAVERVQRRFTKRLPGLRNTSYKNRLKFLNVPSLELRRLHADLFWCYKVVFGLEKVQSDLFYVMNPCTVTRGHKLYRVSQNKTPQHENRHICVTP